MLRTIAIPCAALLLGGCSLINAYDDVLPGEGGGGGGTTSSTSSSGGGGEGGGATTSSSSSTSSSGGGGEGGGGPTGLECQVSDPVQIQDTTGFTTALGAIYDAVYAFPAGAGQNRVIVVRRPVTGGLRTLQLLEVDEDGGYSNGSSESGVNEVLDVTRAANGDLFALVTAVSGGNVVLRLVQWRNGAAITTSPARHEGFFTFPPNSTQPRARLVHVGPGEIESDVLLSFRRGSGEFETSFKRILSAGSMAPSLFLATTTVDGGESTRGLIHSGTGNQAMAHAFVGESGTKRYSFARNATTAPTPEAYTLANGTLGGVGRDNSNALFASVRILAGPSAELRVGARPLSQLGTATDESLTPILTISPLTSFPQQSRGPTFAPNSVLLAGTDQDGGRLGLWIASASVTADQNQLRYQNTQLVAPATAQHSFSAGIDVVSADPIAAQGGKLFVYHTEQIGPAATAEQLYQTRVDCTQP